MKKKVLGCFLILVYGVVANAETGMKASETQGGFQYSEDWQQVSAPPPPGPYQAVTLDPRIPGQEFVLPPSQSAATLPPESTRPLISAVQPNRSQQQTQSQIPPIQRSPEQLPPMRAGQFEQNQQPENWQLPQGFSPYGRPTAPSYNYSYPPRYPVAPGYGAYRYPAAPSGPYGYPGGYRGQVPGNQDIPPPASTSQ